MNKPNGISPSLKDLHQKLDTVDGVTTDFVADSEIIVAFNGRKIGSWVRDGNSLTGAFACEAALLCAASEDEAYRLTVGRLA